MSEKVKLSEVLGEMISREEALRILQTDYLFCMIVSSKIYLIPIALPNA